MKYLLSVLHSCDYCFLYPNIHFSFYFDCYHDDDTVATCCTFCCIFTCLSLFFYLCFYQLLACLTFFISVSPSYCIYQFVNFSMCTYSPCVRILHVYVYSMCTYSPCERIWDNITFLSLSLSFINFHYQLFYCLNDYPPFPVYFLSSALILPFH